MNARSPIFTLVSTLVLACAMPSLSFAGPREDAVAGMVRCLSLLDDRARLTCYDGAAPPLRAAFTGPAPAYVPPPIAFASAPSARASIPVPPPSRKQGWLGGLFSGGGEETRAPSRENVALSRPPPAGSDAERITARLASYRFVQDGYVVITLANGEVWQQVDGESLHQPLKKAAGTYVATITEGLLGTHNLSIQGIAGLYGVKRLR